LKLLIGLILSLAFAGICQAAQGQRPEFHFTPLHGWINDPNGMFEENGIYHLYYQYYGGGWELSDGRFKNGLDWGPMQWGHATSTDLMHWRQQSVAILPDKRIANREVEGMAYSGSVVLDSQNTSGFGSKANPPLVAAYTAADTFGPGSGQRQALAYSLDHGYTWKKYAENPVLPYNNTADFRDPKVFWDEARSRWSMVVTCGDHLCFFRSSNLKLWTPSGRFGDAFAKDEAPWECPDLFPLQTKKDGRLVTKWALLVSVQHGAPSGSFGTRYFIGDFNGETFTPDSSDSTPQWLDYGSDFYAARTFEPYPAGPSKRVLLAWMSNWTYAHVLPAQNYRGEMSVPRIISLKSTARGYYLAQRPAPSIMKRLHNENVSINLDGSMFNQIKKVNSVAVLNVHFKPTGGRKNLSVEMAQVSGGKIKITYSEKNSTLTVDRSDYAGYAFPNPTNVISAPVPQTDEGLKLSILLDRTSMEIFADDGKVTFTNLIYPKNLGPYIVTAGMGR